MSQRSDGEPDARERVTIRRRRHWARLVAEWERTGLSEVVFCRERQITLAPFRWWKSRLSRADARGSESATPSVPQRSSRLVPVRVVPSAPDAGAAPLEVVCGSRTIRVHGDFDAQVLSKLLRAVEDISC